MKFTKLRLVGATNVDLPIIGSEPSGPFVLKSADGLGPPEREVKLAKTVQEGGVRQGTFTQNRQVIVRVGLQPEWEFGRTSSDLRSELYGLLTPKYGDPVKAQIMDSSTVRAQTQGDISRFETAMFAKDPEVQITLDCDYPYLLAPTLQYQLPSKTLASGQTAIDIQNDGTAPAGFWMSITLQSAHTGALKISDNSPTPKTMSISGPWDAGDTFTLDTRPGKRGVWRKASGTSNTVSVLNNLSGSSPWLLLHGGNNQLMINNTAFDFAGSGFGHTPAYWGV